MQKTEKTAKEERALLLRKIEKTAKEERALLLRKIRECRLARVGTPLTGRELQALCEMLEEQGLTSAEARGE